MEMMIGSENNTKNVSTECGYTAKHSRNEPTPQKAIAQINVQVDDEYERAKLKRLENENMQLRATIEMLNRQIEISIERIKERNEQIAKLERALINAYV